MMPLDDSTNIRLGKICIIRLPSSNSSRQTETETGIETLTETVEETGKLSGTKPELNSEPETETECVCV